MPSVLGEGATVRIIHVLRKPLSEGTVAANTLRHGTGGLNIDASRVGGSFVSAGGNNFDVWRSGEGREDRPPIHGRPTFKLASGRWPANVILQHLDGCRCDGVKRVRSHNPDNKTVVGGASTGECYGDYGKRSIVGHADEDGRETVANWVCEPGCPVARLDEQSGVLTSGVMKGQQRGWGFHGIYGASGDTEATCYGDTGGASRFYKQVGGSSE